MTKKDLHKKKESYLKFMDTLVNWKCQENANIVKKYLTESKQGKVRSNGSYKALSYAQLDKITTVLKKLNAYFNKPFSQITPDEWETWYDNLLEDKILQSNGKTYGGSTKSKDVKTTRKFLRWYLGKDKEYPEFTDYWNIKDESPEKIVLTRDEISRMVDSAKSVRDKCMIMLLFDGGLRVTEFASLRWADMIKPEGSDYYVAHVRKETAKTKKSRKVGLPLATDMIESYRTLCKTKEGDLFIETNFMFPMEYGAIHKQLARAGKVTGKKVTPHILRHSSATYYAGICKTYAQFCTRYGWALNSGMAQRYFHGVEADVVIKQAEAHEIARVKAESEKHVIENKQLKERVTELQNRFNLLEKEVERLNQLGTMLMAKFQP